MFFRRKAVGERSYLQIVESRRAGSSIRQHVVATLGRAEDWLDRGKLDQLLQSGARLSETALVLSAVRDGDGLVVDSRRIGAPLIFERLWRETGCQAVIEGLLAERQFQFPVERAIFASVLHRLCVSGSDRACDKWLEGYRVAGFDGIDLHHLYRAIAWLGEELADQEGRTRAPRAIKDLVEERLFARRRDLFNDLDLVFFDTSAVYFHGEGGETLGRRGKSKDHRPELKQVVIGVVIDRHGRPLCSETWPGNATDVQALLPVIDRLRARFSIGRICVVADRGMISARTLAELEARGIEYILGTRERNDAEVRETVLADLDRVVETTVEQQGRLAEHRRQDVFDRVGVDRGKDGADRGAGAVGGHQDRHLLTGQAAPGGFAAALAGLALRLFGIELPRSGIFPGTRSLAAFQDIGFVGLDNSAQRGRIGRDRPQKAMPPAEGGAHRDVAPERRLAHRFPLAQRPGEVVPASLVMQVCQRRPRQGVEGLAAPRTVEPTQAVRPATTHRPCRWQSGHTRSATRRPSRAAITSASDDRPARIP